MNKLEKFTCNDFFFKNSEMAKKYQFFTLEQDINQNIMKQKLFININLLERLGIKRKNRIKLSVQMSFNFNTTC